ncbi:hypothetical protein SAY86_011741 [Trapa natans]|uniref:Uncharacterized protein n=1 Tax=Trapa natans TaxID=22666 RepID=A0AAN7R6P7_TRANT|nr:hypothetical protein SAY86_011741 [Trapa natans]
MDWDSFRAHWTGPSLVRVIKFWTASSELQTLKDENSYAMHILASSAIENGKSNGYSFLSVKSINPLNLPLPLSPSSTRFIADDSTGPPYPCCVHQLPFPERSSNIMTPEAKTLSFGVTTPFSINSGPGGHVTLSSYDTSGQLEATFVIIDLTSPKLGTFARGSNAFQKDVAALEVLVDVGRIRLVVQNADFSRDISFYNLDCCIVALEYFQVYQAPDIASCAKDPMAFYRFSYL